MIQVYKNLWVGNEEDWDKEVANQEGWAIIHAAKEPHHRRLLGYTTQGAPKDDPEYLWAVRGQRLYLNLIDAPKVEFISKDLINTALDFIDAELAEGRKVFVHCNKGESRAPTLALLYLYKNEVLKGSPTEVIEEFTKLYPNYAPGQGMLDFTIQFIEGGDK